MRNAILTLSLGLLALNASAQEFRFSGGYNGSNVSDAGNEHWVGKAGYQFGADLVLGQRWFVRPGIHFLVRNVDYTYSNGTNVTAQDFTYTSRALRVPVVLGFNLLDASDDPPFNVSVFGGPSALMNLSADLDNSSLDVRTRDTQWYLGFGADVTLGFLFVEGGYDVAMSNVFAGDAFRTNPKVNFLHLSAGIRLQLAH
ncbi:MAG: outer membrane beta-barrel protein [Flavobacteriales bacterium]